MIGVYEILNTANGKLYIGSSIDVDKRLLDHANKLKRGGHENAHLQHSFNKHGMGAFYMSAIEECSTDNLLKKEQWWIDALGVVDSGYNICPIAGNCAGRKHTNKTRRKISASKKGTTKPNSGSFAPGIVPWNKGGTHSKEARAKMSASRLGVQTGTRHEFICESCGLVLQLLPSDTRKKFCSRECYGVSIRGKPSWNKGIPFSTETRHRMSVSAKNRTKRNNNG